MSGEQGKLYCGIDPGRDKFGLALAAGETLYLSAILATDEADFALGCIEQADWGAFASCAREGVGPPREALRARICLGNGTYHDLFAKKLQARAVSFETVDERMTTLQARTLYWRLHPPRGLWRLVPLSLRTPPRPVDDLAAWAIARRAQGIKS